MLTSGKRVLTLRSFRIAPGPKVRVYLVPRSVKGDGDVKRDYKDLGALKGSRGNQQYAIAASVDLRRYRSVIFWCVPFTLDARAGEPHAVMSPLAQKLLAPPLVVLDAGRSACGSGRASSRPATGRRSASASRGSSSAA